MEEKKNNDVEIDRNAVETAYCFMHQKQRVYQYSNMEWQKEDIEYAIADYSDQMDKRLFDWLGEGNPDFLHNHKSFGEDIMIALEKLEGILRL